MKVGRRIRSYFFAGIVTLLPVMVTVYVLWTTFKWVDNATHNIVGIWFEQRIPGLGFVAFVVGVTLIGIVATNVVGRHLINLAETVLERIPLVNAIYTSVKQLIEAFNMPKRGAFRQVVLVEYPRKGIYSIGFVSNHAVGDLQDKTDEDVICVFIPTTPNPTSGFIILVPKEQSIPLDMSVEEAFKVVLSGGLLLPEARS